ncbi:MAG: hypothetical protein KME16_26300 [Scytolyngbya sp. HA4215-MV1]|nr:hypothetical protein [Scytolyngbya sp. HA4215-MV1]
MALIDLGLAGLARSRNTSCRSFHTAKDNQASVQQPVWLNSPILSLATVMAGLLQTAQVTVG